MNLPIYMDHAATTALSPAALEEMMPFLQGEMGNPSAVYSYGQTAHNAVEKSRARIAKCIGGLKTEILFTSGGTESDNWALRGLCKANADKGRHVITTAMEHNAVLKTLEDLEGDGFEVTYLKPNRAGQISAEQLEEAIRPDTILISIMLANNVVGTILDLKPLTAVARKHRIPFHTDMVQAAGHIPVAVHRLGVDYASLSAHKFNGPKGVGVLWCKTGRKPPAILTGGGQERGGRSGTENVPAIVGMAAALELSCSTMEEDAEHMQRLAQRIIKHATSLPGVRLTGDPENRLPGFCSFVVDGLKHSVLLINELNDRGICASSGSACSASSKEASHVLLALGYDEALASMSLRITLGRENTDEEVDCLLEHLGPALEAARSNTEHLAPRLRGLVED